MVVEADLDDHRQRPDGLAGIAVGPERNRPGPAAARAGDAPRWGGRRAASPAAVTNLRQCSPLTRLRAQTLRGRNRHKPLRGPDTRHASRFVSTSIRGLPPRYPRLPLRANNIVVDARVTPLDPPGGAEVDATVQRVPAIAFAKSDRFAAGSWRCLWRRLDHTARGRARVLCHASGSPVRLQLAAVRPIASTSVTPAAASSASPPQHRSRSTAGRAIFPPSSHRFSPPGGVDLEGGSARCGLKRLVIVLGAAVA
jgi:hypothetical protein